MSCLTTVGSIPFWRDEPITEVEAQLLSAMILAHEENANRQNCSTVCLMNAAYGSGSYTQAIASALSSLGIHHGPVAEAYDVISGKVEVEPGMIVPGWGNSFVKDDIDPAWVRVDQILAQHYPEISEVMMDITLQLHGYGKKVYPNPGGFTASIAIAIGLPRDISAYLFVTSRLAKWSEIFMKVENKEVVWA